MNKKGSHHWLWVVIPLVFLFLGFFGVNQFSDINFSIGKPFKVSISPDFINEGDYTNTKDVLKFSLIVSPTRKKLSYLELTQDNVIIERKDKNSNTEVSFINTWVGISNNDNVIYYDIERSSSKFRRGEEKFILTGCENCFMGEYAPYVITMTFNYALENGEKKIKVIKKNIKILG